ncbi:TatD family hydrolase [Psychrobacter glacincola]|uniref:TatD family hydrolase n=1 Tax=Psychrobacter glacincola TaxID=56810 RepID=UPI003BB6481F
MMAIGASGINSKVRADTFPLIDTHTHFDAPVFDEDRDEQAQFAYDKGVRHLVLVGYLYRHFSRLYETQQQLKVPYQFDKKNHLNQESVFPKVHIALGLHPFYIEQHTDAHLEEMAQMLNAKRPLAIGEIGLDTFTNVMKQPDIFAKQQRFFSTQLDMAVAHQLPVMLHIRKAHAEALALLKAHDYDAHKLGGIAHSFSGGVQEATAFAKLGFKLGVTGQITNPNAKKLRLAIQAAVDSYGIDCLVIETDCPDMMPILCQTVDSDLEGASYSSASVLAQDKENEWGDTLIHNRNIPENLFYVLYSLSELLNVPVAILAQQLWLNSCNALQTKWSYTL